MLGDQWYALNAARKYPLDDLSTAIDDAGVRLPDGLLADVGISGPFDWGTRLAVIGASVQPGGVSVVFGLASYPSDPTTLQLRPVASASIYSTGSRAYKPVLVTPLVPGVGGVVVFGPRADGVSDSWTFSNSNAVLLPRCFRPRKAPVASISVSNGAAKPVGPVKLVAGPDIAIDQELRVIPGYTDPQPAIVFRLAQAAVGQNVFDAYKGPCGGRPESNTCDRPPIETINAISPDCDGVIRLNFEWPLRARPFAGGGGFAVDYAYGLGVVCGAPNIPTQEGVLPTTYKDGCPPLGSVDPDANAVPAPPVKPSAVPIGSTGYTSTLPICTNFEAPQWELVNGDFAPEYSIAPPFLTACDPFLPVGLRGKDPSTLSIELFNDFGYMPNIHKVIETNLYILPNVARAGGGIVINHRRGTHPPGDSSPDWDDFFIFEIACDLGVAQLRQWAGGVTKVLDQTLPIVFHPGSWYWLKVTITAEGFSVRITGEVFTITAGPTVNSLGTVSTLSNSYYPSDGLFGVGADRASALFGHFAISEVPP